MSRYQRDSIAVKLYVELLSKIQGDLTVTEQEEIQSELEKLALFCQYAEKVYNSVDWELDSLDSGGREEKFANLFKEK